MLFTNKRSVSSHTSIKGVPGSGSNIGMNITVRRPPSVIIPTVVPDIQPINNARQILWGAPTWYFFHMMAEKVKPEKFAEIRNKIFDIIKEVCGNLPCPSCTQHANANLSKINFNSIRTKEDLKMMLFEFHNSVNKKTNAPLFTIDELNDKYSKGNFINIINYFIHFYKMEHHAIRMMADDMYRKRSAKKILDWLHSNYNNFEK
jgi:hypothetical protein